MSNYSWGQIRFLLQRFVGPGIEPDTIDHAIRARYELILSAMEWKGIEQDGMIQTTAAYNAGQITLTTGSTAVAGNGTVWTAAMNGWQLFLGASPIYTVTILTPTSLLLDRPYEGTGGGAYWLAQAYYDLPDNCRTLRTVGSPVTGRNLDEMDEGEFGELDGDLLNINLPASNYILKSNGVDSQTGQTVQRLLLYPVPVLAQGYPITYDATAESFDGTNTADGPLSFVSASALIAGCKADLEKEKDKPNPVKVALYKADFDEWLTGMLHVENSKTPPQRMRLDESYTRHRTARYLRSGGAIITRNNLFFDSDQGLGSGAGTPKTDTFTGNGTQTLFNLSQVPVSPVVVSVNGAIKSLATDYTASGKLVVFLSGAPANGAAIQVIYTY